jgi:methyl-accepting chemotaxis protein
MVVALSFYLKDIISTNNFYQSVAQPIVYQSQSSNTDINRHSSYLQSYLRSGNIDHKKEAERMLYNKLPKRIKAMVELSKKWDSDPQFLIRANDLMLQFEAINETYLLFENSGTSGDQLLNETYLPMLIKYGIDMKGFNDYQYNNYGQDLVNIFDQADKYKYLALFILLLLFGILGLFINNTSKKIKNGIDKLKEDIGTISLGNFPERIEKSDNELITIEDGLISLVGNLKNVEQFANEVGKGSFDSELSVFNNEGNLGRSLASMRSSLKQVSADGVIRDWNNTGLAKFGSIIQENTGDIGELIDLLIRELVKYTDSLQGGIFIVNNEDENDVHLELLGCYAYERKKFLERKVKPGQGYIGQTYLEGEPVYLRDIPQNYMSITSGLGKTNPTSLLIQPLISNDKIEGVLEIASLKEYPEHVQKFVSQVCENIASSISVAKTNTNMGKMIKDSTELTEQLQAQEEELRQNTEELQATQEDMERRIGELEKENNELKGELNNLQTT